MIATGYEGGQKRRQQATSYELRAAKQARPAGYMHLCLALAVCKGAFYGPTGATAEGGLRIDMQESSSASGCSMSWAVRSCRVVCGKKIEIDDEEC